MNRASRAPRSHWLKSKIEGFHQQQSKLMCSLTVIVDVEYEQVLFWQVKVGNNSLRSTIRLLKFHVPMESCPASKEQSSIIGNCAIGGGRLSSEAPGQLAILVAAELGRRQRFRRQFARLLIRLSSGSSRRYHVDVGRSCRIDTAASCYRRLSGPTRLNHRQFIRKCAGSRAEYWHATGSISWKLAQVIQESMANLET